MWVGAPPPSAADRGERSPRHTIELLDSISVDIARMIDHDAAMELWERYKRGERNVFTRRLYTLQGQQTFEEIRRKYRRDPEFRDTVNRYIEEFERLLDQVGRDGDQTDRPPSSGNAGVAGGNVFCSVSSGSLCGRYSV